MRASLIALTLVALLLPAVTVAADLLEPEVRTQEGTSECRETSSYFTGNGTDHWEYGDTSECHKRETRVGAGLSSEGASLVGVFSGSEHRTERSRDYELDFVDGGENASYNYRYRTVEEGGEFIRVTHGGPSTGAIRADAYTCRNVTDQDTHQESTIITPTTPPGAKNDRWTNRTTSRDCFTGVRATESVQGTGTAADGTALDLTVGREVGTTRHCYNPADGPESCILTRNEASAVASGSLLVGGFPLVSGGGRVGLPTLSHDERPLLP